MGREVRMVPGDWFHPRNEHGYYVPMFAKFPYSDEEVREGISKGWLKGEYPYGIPLMPQWEDAERTHYQMYENTSEGTPISPVFADPSDLARWLADNRASAFGGITASYDEWLAMIEIGSVPSFVIVDRGFLSGVAAAWKGIVMKDVR